MPIEKWQKATGDRNEWKKMIKSVDARAQNPVSSRQALRRAEIWFQMVRRCGSFARHRQKKKPFLHVKGYF
jgi:hypothetical protein